MLDKYSLKLRQAMPLKDKIRFTERRIHEWVEHFGVNGCYVSFSGGKDSTVLLYIVRSLYPDIEAVFVDTGLEYPDIEAVFVDTGLEYPDIEAVFVDTGLEYPDIEAVFVDTGLEYPEIRQFVKSFHTVTILRPEMRFDKVLEKYGYPVVSKEVSECIDQARKALITGKYPYRLAKLMGTAKDKDGNKSMYNQEKWKFLLDAPFKISNKCCNVMKKKPAHDYHKKTGKVPFIATMADESRLREQKYLQQGCNGFKNKIPTSTPIAFWTEQDILEYIDIYKIPIASVLW